MQTVGNLLEDLSRFGREARVEPEINFQSFAPNCFCTPEGYDPEEMERLKEMDEQLDTAQEKLEELQRALNEIKEYLDDGETEKAQKIADDNYEA